MLEELGVEYENVPVANTRAPEHLAIDPNGRVPALVDGDTVMWESLAINLYLARRFPSDLSAKSQGEEADVLKWSFWAQSELEDFFEHIASLEEIPADWYERAPRVLDGALGSRGYLVGGRFTVADLNVANMFNGPVSSRLDLARFRTRSAGSPPAASAPPRGACWRASSPPSRRRRSPRPWPIRAAPGSGPPSARA